MKSTLFFVALGFIGVVGALGTACSSSSTPEKGDASVKEDTGKPGHDSGKKADSGKVTDAGATDGGGCSSLTADFQGVGAPDACVSCVETKCCPQGLACAAATGCKAIETCIWACVTKPGAVPETCAYDCIGGDSGVANTPAQKAAQAIAECISPNCNTVCN
jgi:hypothetical protein